MTVCVGAYVCLSMRSYIVKVRTYVCTCAQCVFNCSAVASVHSDKTAADIKESMYIEGYMNVYVLEYMLASIIWTYIETVLNVAPCNIEWLALPGSIVFLFLVMYIICCNVLLCTLVHACIYLEWLICIKFLLPHCSVFSGLRRQS